MVCSPSPRTTTSKSCRKGSGSQVGKGPPATSSWQRSRRASRKPETVLQHGNHAVDANHFYRRGEGLLQGLVTLEECAVEEMHLVPCLLQTGCDGSNTERGEAEDGAVASGFEKGVDEQHRSHGSL